MLPVFPNRAALGAGITQGKVWLWHLKLSSTPPRPTAFSHQPWICGQR